MPSAPRRWIPWAVVAAVVVVAVVLALIFVPPFLERRSAQERYTAAVELPQRRGDRVRGARGRRRRRHVDG